MTAGDRARGVACLRAGVTRMELAELHEAGIRGVRFNFARRAHVKPDTYYLGLADLIAGLGWHVVVYLEATDLLDRWQLFTRLPTVVVVDHMALPDVSQPLDAPGFTLFQQLMREHGQAKRRRAGVCGRAAGVRRFHPVRAADRHRVPRPGDLGYWLASPRH